MIGRRMSDTCQTPVHWPEASPHDVSLQIWNHTPGSRHTQATEKQDLALATPAGAGDTTVVPMNGSDFARRDSAIPTSGALPEATMHALVLGKRPRESFPDPTEDETVRMIGVLSKCDMKQVLVRLSQMSHTVRTVIKAQHATNRQVCRSSPEGCTVDGGVVPVT